MQEMFPLVDTVGLKPLCLPKSLDSGPMPDSFETPSQKPSTPEAIVRFRTAMESMATVPGPSCAKPSRHIDLSALLRAPTPPVQAPEWAKFEDAHCDKVTVGKPEVTEGPAPKVEVPVVEARVATPEADVGVSVQGPRPQSPRPEAVRHVEPQAPSSDVHMATDIGSQVRAQAPTDRKSVV